MLYESIKIFFNTVMYDEDENIDGTNFKFNF